MVARRCLVTGATGGLGRILVEQLAQSGREIVATGRNAEIGSLLERSNVRFVPADLARDDLAPLTQGVVSIFHLAALSSPWGKYEDFVSANYEATLRLLNAARTAQCRTFIFTSTPSIYTRPIHQLNLTEASPLPARLVNAYARTKLLAERAVLSADTPEFATVALRPRAIIGPYDTVLLPRFVRAAQKGLMPLPGNGVALLEPTDARDVCSALIAAEARAEFLGGQVFNISGGQPVPLAELAEHIFSRLGQSVKMPKLPARLALLVATLLEGAGHLRSGQSEPTITRYAAMVLGWSQTFDLSAARKALEWTPRYSPFEAIDWALERRGHA